MIVMRRIELLIIAQVIVVYERERVTPVVLAEIVVVSIARIVNDSVSQLVPLALQDNEIYAFSLSDVLALHSFLPFQRL